MGFMGLTMKIDELVEKYIKEVGDNTKMAVADNELTNTRKAKTFNSRKLKNKKKGMGDSQEEAPKG